MAGPTWDEMEHEYLETARSRRQLEDAKLNEQYEERREEISRELESLSRERDRLEAQMRRVLENMSIQEVERDKLVRRLDEELAHRANLRELEDRERLSWFKQQRALRKDPVEPQDMAPPAGSTRSNGRRSSKRDSGGRRSAGGWTSINGAQPPDEAEPSAESINIFHGSQRNPMGDVVNGGAKLNGDRGNIVINDAVGREVGRIKVYHEPNRYSDAVANLPIRRPVTLREGRTMDANELDSIYTAHSGKKPSKWVSCMIQATGNVQQQPCTNCERGQGLFSECILIEDPTGALPSCANCEWNHQKCTGAAGTSTDAPAKQRHKLPGFPAVAPATPTFDGAQTILSDRTSKPKSGGRRSLPALTQQIMDTESGESTPNVKKEEPEDPTEINRSTLLLQHNGQVYTAPPMFAGTPVEKIRMGDGYWNPEWEPLLGIIEPQLQKWQEKLELLRNTPEAVRHTVFLANRQVNRGQAVVDFLKNDDSEFHPYQFVGKEMMNKFYKTFINYDTLFRLVNVHEELKKFDLDVTPLDWLRQRMYELSIKQGEKFSLSKTVHDLYHDAKLKSLREKHGFGNIGRPSGYKLGSRTNPDGTPREKASRQSSGASTRRKRVSSIKQRIDDPEIFQPPQPQEEYLQPVTPRLQKRQRLEPAPAPPPEPVAPPADPYEDDLEYSGWTSTDSFSAGRIMHLDWRVYQIKTTSLTTSTEVTQYWTWKNDENTFEHQVLRDVFPKVTWGYYQKPIDFNLRLNDIKEIEYASDSQKIVVHLHEGGKDTRGSVLAHFKRERTKRRFLAFARKKGVQLLKSTPADVEHAWKTMVSEELPDEDSDE